MMVMMLPLLIGRRRAMHTAFEERREARIGEDHERERDGDRFPRHQCDAIAMKRPRHAPKGAYVQAVEVGSSEPRG